MDIGLTEHGSDWLWTVFAIMLASDLGFIVWHWRLTRGQRVFHQLPILILTTAMVAYFSMASNLGAAGIETEFRTKGTRAIWYVRYIYWVCQHTRSFATSKPADSDANLSGDYYPPASP